MGHIRLGRLPRTRQWSEVVGLLGAAEASESDVAAAIVRATRGWYAQSAADPGLLESVRALAQLASAARAPDFRTALGEHGFDLPEDASAPRALHLVFQELDRRLPPVRDRTVFTHFAVAAFRQAITEAVQSQSATLFDSGLADTRSAFRSFSTERGFGRLARGYFGRLVAQSLLYFSDKETANLLGSSSRLSSQRDLLEFNSAIEQYAHEAARVVEPFSGEWFSKRNWLRDAPQRAGGFAAHAMRKLAADLERTS